MLPAEASSPAELALCQSTRKLPSGPVAAVWGNRWLPVVVVLIWSWSPRGVPPSKTRPWMLKFSISLSFPGEPMLPHTTRKSPLELAAVAGYQYSFTAMPRVVVLTWNSAPSSAPAEEIRWARMLVDSGTMESEPKLSQATRKSPLGARATAGRRW